MSRKMSEEEQYEHDVAEGLALAQDITRKVFGSTLTAEFVFKVYDRLPPDADKKEVDSFVADLFKAKDVSDELFGTVDAFAAIGVYDRMFLDEDDLDDEEDDD